MTVEELEIIVSASIEPALKEIKKLMPQIKQQVIQAAETVQKAMEQIDMKKVTSKVQQAVQQVKKKIDNLKKSNKNNELSITVNNKEAQKQISQVEKQIESLQKKISASQMKLNMITPKLDAITQQTTRELTPAGISSDNPAIQNTISNNLANNKEYTSLAVQEEKLVQEIKLYNTQLDEAKTKMSQLKQETNQISTSQSKLTSFFSAFKGKLEQAKASMGGFKGIFNQLPKITQSVTNNIKKMGTGLKSGLGHVLKYAAALFSLRGIYSVLSNAARSWLSSQNAGAQQLSANIEYMKYAMGSVFAPVIEYVISLVYQLMKAIQSLVYAFSGINIFAKATASSMNNTASSANKASKSLSGVHSEINNVSENDNSSGSGTASPNIDLSEVDNTPNSIIEAIKNGNWAEIGTIIGQKLNETMNNIDWNTIKNGAKNIASNITSFLNGFINTTDWSQVGNTFAQGLNTAIYFAYEFVTTFDWMSFGKAIGDSINGFFSNVDWIKAGQTLGEGIKGILSTICSILYEINWIEIGKELANFLINLDWHGILEGLQDVIANALIAIFEIAWGLVIDGLGSKIDLSWENAWENVKEVADISMGVVDDIIAAGCKKILKNMGYSQDEINYIWKHKWEITGQYLSQTWDNIKKTIKDTMNNIGNFISNAWDGINKTISNVINGIKNTIQDVLNSISSVWSGIWNGIKLVVSNVWNGIWSCIKGVINSILGGIESFVNGTIKGINILLSGISSVANAVGSLIGLDPINLRLNYVSLPRLAKGNVAYSETMAIFGEYAGASTNPEITTPQNIMAETFDEVLSNHEWNNQQSSNSDLKQLVIQFGSTKVALEIERLLQQARRQNGVATVTI